MSISLFDSITQPILKNLYKVKTEGFDKIDLSEPAIFMPNHVSLLDPFLLGMFLPKEVYFVANTGIAEKYAAFMKGRNVITVDPANPYSVRKMIKIIKEGKSLVIFPEGRITRTGSLMKIYSGISYIALKTGAKVYPVIINGAEKSKFSYLKDKINIKTFPDISLHIGDSFYINRDDKLSMKEQKKTSSDFILSKLQEEKLKSNLKSEVNLFNELVSASETHGKKMTIIEDIGGSVSYDKMLLGSYVLSKKLDSTLKEDRNVGVLLPNSIGHAVTLFSLFKIGKVPAILNFSMGLQSLIDCCETADLKTILTSREFVEKGKLTDLINGLSSKCKVHYLEDLKDSITTKEKLSGLMEHKLKKLSTATTNEVILFTSGSESKPKGVVLSHNNLYSNIQQAKTVIDFTSKDKILNALPMFHSFGLTAGSLLPILCGVPVYLYPSPLHYKVVPEIAYDKLATIIFGTSTFLEGYAKYAHQYDFFSIRYALAGAEKLKDSVRDLWFEKFGIRVFEGYGTTETAPVLSLNTALNYKKGTVGKFVPGVEYKLEKVEGIENGGNLFVKGPNVMKGYLIHGKGFIPCPEWYDCGDIVSIDSEGFISIHSRLKRFAKIAGEMVSLNLVEQIATELSQNTGYFAVNVPDARKGERIILFTIDKNVDAKAFEKELKKYINEKNYSALYSPSSIVTLDKVPLLGSGKTDYVTLKKLAENL